MECGDGSVLEEPQELAEAASSRKSPESPPMQISVNTKSPKYLRSPNSPKSLSYQKAPGKFITGKGSPSKGSPVKNERHSHSPIDGRPKKGGSGGKGTWGGLLDTECDYSLDPKDPNYDSEEYDHKSRTKLIVDFEEYKKKVTVIVEEYFATDDVVSTANELRELGVPSYNYYFIKKLVSMSMDRHDKEKEMAAILISALYADIIDPSQVYEGFTKLVESADDLIVDIPDTVDILALFIARAVVDDILPPAFIKKEMASLPADSKGIDVLKRAEKSYLAAPLHAEIIERRWGGSKNKTVEDVKAKINNLLVECIVSGDKKEACRCIKDLKVPFFHHEIIKRALVMAMERQQAEGQLLELLKDAAEKGFINTSQITKGFNRVIDAVDDLSLDIPNARGILQSLISKAASEGWLCASSLKSLSVAPVTQPLQDSAAKIFKAKAQSIVQEYFLSGDMSEVSSCLECENSNSSPELNATFVKRLITLAMDRKNREKEMASVLLSSLCFPADDVVNGFAMLIESADDTALDNPVVVEDLAMFLARAVVDEVLAPQHLEEIGSQFLGLESIGSKVLQMAKSLLKARLSGERILRCWGGAGSSRPGWAVEDVKDKIGKLLEEFESGGDIREAYRCIKELGMPFFHHEVVKKALVTIIEKKSRRLWGLLEESFHSGLITSYQMMKGFGRVAESLDDLALDVPDAEKQFVQYVEKAKIAGWLDSSFCCNKSGHTVENGNSQ
ncbi:MA3 DOMAIN-CONTAINING TRANSLATION REGULATORY FACTOR 2 [Ricinus communis]|uniref:MA3 DOMAIN-CONTAINING TRANSLATION REGULATORY FACTOR 2 n=1 Tax=Ricinus communis TaxID=3988 RepID=UPI0007726A75|nr:MA3 DOMAIN-CONTAINING TRANSLATION REGULATORY FACTOR 2 [Ricinus communis]XP_048226573.1 MA3 DOMAIN-CONTAINING TRANSLATION REGULATORY FACTOR 2 [Ricinus communis]|eukprot:XP_025014525.1 programmed cell death protein 4 [Ricinus communis]